MPNPSTNAPHYWLIVPAAGAGKRFGGDMPKQYLVLHGQRVIQHSLNRLCDAFCQLQLPLRACVVPISADDHTAATLDYQYTDFIRFVQGGAERMLSVLAGLSAIASAAKPDDWVLVHDVARPCIHQNSLSNLIKTLHNDPIGGVLAVPVRDTLKRVNLEVVSETVPRDHLWQVQTPQMFRYGLLLSALRAAVESDQMMTDEAGAMEAAGHSVRVVQGRSDNIKITYADDLALAGAILSAQG